MADFFELPEMVEDIEQEDNVLTLDELKAKKRSELKTAELEYMDEPMKIGDYTYYSTSNDITAYKNTLDLMKEEEQDSFEIGVVEGLVEVTVEILENAVLALGNKRYNAWLAYSKLVKQVYEASSASEVADIVWTTDI